MSEPLLSVEAARNSVLAAVTGPTQAEIVFLSEALGRVVAEPVLSKTALPPWDNSAMDGYAIRAADVAAATDAKPVRLDVVGEVAAGALAQDAVRRGTAIRIATGAPLPDGADSVVRVEDTTPLGPDGQAAGPRGRDATGPVPAACLVHVAVSAGEAVRRAGSDLGIGALVVEPGRVVDPAVVAVIAGTGGAQVAVHRRPIVGILATGDELVPAGRPLGPAGIPDANGPALVALVEAAGGDPRVLGIAGDRLEDVRSRLCAGLAEAPDAIMVSGGVSVGPYDVVRSAFAELGQVEVWRVAVQPGKPFAFGTATPAEGSARPPVLLFGLPGNPVSTFVTFELFARPALRRLAGHPPGALVRPLDRAVLLDSARTSSGRRAFLRVVAERDDRGAVARDDRGRVRVYLAGGQGSHVLSALAAADALAIVPETQDAVAPGDPVDLWWLDRGPG